MNRNNTFDSLDELLKYRYRRILRFFHRPESTLEDAVLLLVGLCYDSETHQLTLLDETLDYLSRSDNDSVRLVASIVFVQNSMQNASRQFRISTPIISDVWDACRGNISFQS